MDPTRNNGRVSLEELLHLKRAERPSPEFWEKFERELHEKQLTALVQKRRWWHEMPLWLNRRLLLPTGAAAAVALTIVTVRVATSPQLVRVERAPSNLAIQEPAFETLPATEVAMSQPPARQTEQPAPVVAQGGGAGASAPAAVSSRDVTELADMPQLSGNTQESVRPSARSIAANLARLEQSEPELVNSVMGGRLSAPAKASTVSLPGADPVAESTPRYRLIARYVDHALTPEPAAPAPVRERIARRLGDDITERISRIGVEGSRVSLKF